MITCGIKLTHDSSVAVFEEKKLVFSIELEKIDNNNRFKIVDSVNDISIILKGHGIKMSEIDLLVVDGWVGKNQSKIKVRNTKSIVDLPVAPYHEANSKENVLKRHLFKHNIFKTRNGNSYESYSHVAGHLLSAYYTSPFHLRGESSHLLVWDGGMFPRLYYFDVEKNKVENLGPLFHMGVNIYSIFAQHFRPFRLNENVIKDELSLAGKVMAYIAYGKVKREILSALKKTYLLTLGSARRASLIPQYPYIFAQTFKKVSKNKNFLDEDILASFHFYLEDLLISSLKKTKRRQNLCISGGAALNIKWNSRIRETQLFQEVWIPPFPNDAGSAIGSGLCGLHEHGSFTGNHFFDWNVYSGPGLVKNKSKVKWETASCSVNLLAKILHDEQEPVVFLNDRAELGPRALGNRSILASATSESIKNRLNFLKIRESFRPIAPVCLEEFASNIFDPGTRDDYMLFEHKVRDEWTKKIPGVLHVDKTARLQTVNPLNNPTLYSLLKEYHKLSGIPLLCNTSANFKGCGFFPDIQSAINWGQVKYVWSNDILYFRAD